MAKCLVCGKKPSSGCNVSHSHVRTKRMWSPNLQRVKTVLNNKMQTVTVCTKCLKAGKIKKA